MEPNEIVAKFIKPLTSAFIKSNTSNPIGMIYIYTGMSALSRIFPQDITEQFVEISVTIPISLRELNYFDYVGESVELFANNLIVYLKNFEETIRWLLRLSDETQIHYNIENHHDEAYIVMTLDDGIEPKQYHFVKFIFQTRYKSYYYAFTKTEIREYYYSNSGEYYAPLTVIDGVAQPTLGYLIWDIFRYTFIDPLTEFVADGAKRLEDFYKVVFLLNKMQEYGSCNAFTTLVQRCTTEETKTYPGGALITSSYLYSEVPKMKEYLEQTFEDDDKAKEKFLDEFIRFI
jgi:hypothetical protein